MACLKRIVIVSVLICLLSFLDLVVASFHSRPVDAAVSSSGQVYVVAGKRLYCLQSTNIQNTELVTTKDTVAVKVVLSSDESILVVCFLDGTCIIYSVEQGNCSYILFEYRISPAVANTCVAVIEGLSEPGHFFFGSSGIYQHGENNLILVREYDLSAWQGQVLLRSSENFVITNNSFVSRKFYYAFQDSSNVYFVVVDTSTNTSNTSQHMNSVKVIRVCQDFANDSSFNAMTEVELHCSSFGTGEVMQNSINVIEIFEGTQEMSVVVGFKDEDGYSFCSFDVLDIDMAMETVFQECIDGIQKIPLPWMDYNLITPCADFDKAMVSECFFGSANSASSVRALASLKAVRGKTVLELSEQVNVTASIAVTIDGVFSIYVAVTNQSRHAILKFYITSNKMPHLFEARDTVYPVILLKVGNEQIYAFTETNVINIDLENCSSHGDCFSCTTSTDPLCGWCVLEKKCSRRSTCENFTLNNRWVTSDQHCIERIGIIDKNMEVSTTHKVNTLIAPPTATLPTLNNDEHYFCSLMNPQVNYSVLLIYNEETGECLNRLDSFPPFNNSQIEIRVSLLSPKGLVLFQAEDAILLYNCSHMRSCKDCHTVSICGWCLYGHVCTASPRSCQSQDDWINSSSLHNNTDDSVCPVILPAINGRYLFPVGAEGNFTLHTRRLPPPVTELQYACVLQYQDSTRVYIDAMYDSQSEDHQIVCLVRSQQILFSSSSNIFGKERLHLDLVWLNRSGNVQYVFDFLRYTDDYIQYDDQDGPTQSSDRLSHNDMEVYNCTTAQSSNSCSSCLSLNVGSGYNCGWCSVGQYCISGLENCFYHFVRSSGFCPSPRISSISPISGHIYGGTVVTIIGTDLGVTVGDVAGVSFGNSPCSIMSFTPGTEIVCTTTQSNVELNVNVTADIRRRNANNRRAEFYSFRYALPVISSVFPQYGPVSGGTTVTIRGVELNISNSSLTTAIIAGVQCDISQVSELEVHCVTRPNLTPIADGIVALMIDGHNTTLDGQGYSYMEDPVYNSIHPNVIIPAGGVLLTFTGVGLNVSQKPRLQISIENVTLTSMCPTSNSTTLQCLAPEVPIYVADNRYGQRLTYTVIMDSSPGPLISDNSELQLELRRNPEFVDILDSDRVHIGTLDKITIIGRYIDSVDISEIDILFGDIPCIVSFEEHNSTHLIFRCSQLELPLLQVSTFDVMVSIANGTLKYKVGQLTYIPPHNCSMLASSCSSCLALNLNTGFKCGWCNREDVQPDGCSHFEGCPSNYISNISNIDLCDPPRISSISPLSGHTHGGTTVTISGSDLGVTVDDIVQVLFGNFPCIIDRQHYSPGTKIVCNTTRSTDGVEGEVLVSVVIRRGSVYRNATYHNFRYTLPAISSVFPQYGPVSGGTTVSIRGTKLDISNTSLTTATIAGILCDIRSISSDEIICISKPSSQVQEGPVQLHIDKGTALNEQNLKYSFFPDPAFTKVQPQNTIPAGGVTLMFGGQYLNVTQQPTLIIIIEDTVLTTNCTADGSATLYCIAPVLLQLGGANDTFSASLVLNYTIKMDNAPGPSNGNSLLELRVEPNPVLSDILPADREYTGSGDRITLPGKNLDSVQTSEIRLTMNDKVCDITFIILQPSQIILECDPPEFSQLQDNLLEVKVIIANGSLVYSVGTLEYIRPSGFSFSRWAPLVYALLGALALLAIIIACVVLIICILCILKRSNSRESISSPQTMELNVSDNGYMTGEENVYDSIPDTLVHNTMELSRELSLPNTLMFPTDDVCLGSNDVFQEPHNKNVSEGKKRRGSLPPIPTGNDDYIEMRSHSVSSKDRNEILSPKRHSINFNEVSVHSQPAVFTTDYVAMLPGTSPKEIDCGHPSTLNFVNRNSEENKFIGIQVGVHSNDNNIATVTRDTTSESSA